MCSVGNSHYIEHKKIAKPGSSEAQVSGSQIVSFPSTGGLDIPPGGAEQTSQKLRIRCLSQMEFSAVTIFTLVATLNRDKMQQLLECRCDPRKGCCRTGNSFSILLQCVVPFAIRATALIGWAVSCSILVGSACLTFPLPQSGRLERYE